MVNLFLYSTVWDNTALVFDHSVSSTDIQLLSRSTMEGRPGVLRKNERIRSSIVQLLLAALGVHSVSAGFIDMDTPLDKRTTKSLIDGSVYHLVSW